MIVLQICRRATLLGVLVGLLSLAGGMIPSATAQGAAVLPDLLTVVPSNLVAVARDADVRLFFTNVIVNFGAGRFQVRPVNEGTQTTAYQQLLNASGSVVAEFPVSTYAYHPEHRHWHIDAVAEYTMRAGTLNGPIVVQATKVTFCLIDTEQILPKGVAGNRTYVGCNAALQGITNGWADEYINGLPGQQLPLAGVPAGDYYLISTSDPLGRFVEANDNNNTAWVKFRLSFVNGAPQIAELDHSPCEGDLCGSRK
jgi:hypothetical protein